ncbi:unnamed protein product, partial [Laminaria digitata]
DTASPTGPSTPKTATLTRRLCSDSSKDVPGPRGIAAPLPDPPCTRNKTDTGGTTADRPVLTTQLPRVPWDSPACEAEDSLPLSNRGCLEPPAPLPHRGPCIETRPLRVR